MIGLVTTLRLVGLDMSDVPHLDVGFPLLWLQVGLPFLAAVIGGATQSNRRFSGRAVVGLTALTFVVSLLGQWEALADTYRWHAPFAGRLLLAGWDSDLGLVATPQTVAAAATLSLVALATQAFTHWYLAYDERYPAFATGLAVAQFGTLLVLLGADVVLVALGWGLIAVTAFALTDHWEADVYRDGASRAAMTLALGGLLLVSGLVLLSLPHHSTAVGTLVQAAGEPVPGGPTGILLVALGILVGAAQVPVVAWPAFVGRGPLPGLVGVHLAGVGAASVALALRLQPVLLAWAEARWLLFVVAALTTVLAGLAALAQRDLTDLLVLVTAAGLGEVLVITMLDPAPVPDAAWFALLSLVVSTSLLALVACWMSVLAGATTLARVSRLARLHTALRFPVASALLALGGVVPFMGFVGHHALLELARSDQGQAGGIGLVVVLAAVGLFAAAACRVWLVLTHRTTHEELMARRGLDPAGSQIDDFFTPAGTFSDTLLEDVDNDPGPWTQTLLVTLGLVCLGAGILILTPVLAVPDRLFGPPTFMITAVVVVAIAVTAALGWRRFHNDPLYLLPPRVVEAVDLHRWGGAPLVAVGRGVDALARRAARVDTAALTRGTDGVGEIAKLAARVGQRLHSTRPTSAVAVVAAGTLLLAVVGVIAW